MEGEYLGDLLKAFWKPLFFCDGRQWGPVTARPRNARSGRGSPRGMGGARTDGDAACHPPLNRASNHRKKDAYQHFSANKTGGKKMKKIFLPLILVIILCLPATAQEFKILGGPVFSSFSDQWPIGGGWYLFESTSGNYDPFKGRYTGVFGGFGVEIRLFKKLWLEVDGLYKESGDYYRVDTWIYDSYLYDNKIKEFYIPVLFKGRFLKSPWPYFLAGGNFSFIFSHHFNLYYRAEASPDFEKIVDNDMQDYTARTNLGAVFGLGFEVPYSKGKMSVEARYELGLKNLLKNYGYYSENIKTRQFLLVFGLRI
jgi:hypothetical protein